MRVLIRYARSGPARYISHLDMQRVFARAIRRSGITVEYSQGFNPHILMSFASPLSVGYATEADYLELMVGAGEDLGSIGARLNDAMTGDIEVTFAGSLENIKGKLMALNHSAAYRIAFALENAHDCDKIEKAVHEIMDSGEYIVKDRKGREKDIAALILQAAVQGDTVNTVLKNSSVAAMNPRLFVDAVLDGTGLTAACAITRTECYACYDGKTVPFSDLCGKPDA